MHICIRDDSDDKGDRASNHKNKDRKSLMKNYKTQL